MLSRVRTACDRQLVCFLLFLVVVCWLFLVVGLLIVVCSWGRFRSLFLWRCSTRSNGSSCGCSHTSVNRGAPGWERQVGAFPPRFIAENSQSFIDDSLCRFPTKLQELLVLNYRTSVLCFAGLDFVITLLNIIAGLVGTRCGKIPVKGLGIWSYCCRSQLDADIMAFDMKPFSIPEVLYLLSLASLVV